MLCRVTHLLTLEWWEGPAFSQKRDPPWKDCLFKVQTRIYFATPFIISEVCGGLTSKLQATVSINNALINGSKTSAKSIKSITLQQTWEQCWTMRPFNKGSNTQPSPVINKNNQLPFIQKTALRRVTTISKNKQTETQVRFAQEITTSVCSWSLLQIFLTIQSIGSWKLFLFGALCLHFTYSPILRCNYTYANLWCSSLAQRGLANGVVRAVPAEANTRPGVINISKDNETNSARSYMPVWLQWAGEGNLGAEVGPLTSGAISVD